MNLKTTSKLKRLIIALCVLLNPIIASAGVLLSDSVHQVMEMNKHQTVNTEQQVKDECHDHGASNTTDEKKNTSQDCCEDGSCSCGQTTCHGSTAVINNSNFSFDAIADSYCHKTLFYSSFTSTPNSPPPIV